LRTDPEVTKEKQSQGLRKKKKRAGQARQEEGEEGGSSGPIVEKSNLQRIPRWRRIPTHKEHYPQLTGTPTQVQNLSGRVGSGDPYLADLVAGR
jgi:hypothetical protein